MGDATMMCNQLRETVQRHCPRLGGGGPLIYARHRKYSDVQIENHK
jgi:hypothetical protein